MTREPPADEYSLLAWIESQALEANNKMYDAYCKDDHEEGMYYKGVKQFAEKVASKIRSGRVNQRPHFDGM